MKVLKFGAVWCPGCLVMRPRWKDIESQYPLLETQYFDFDEEKEAVNRWNITTVLPAFIFLDKNDNELTRLTGEPSKKSLISLIEKYKDQ